MQTAPVLFDINLSSVRKILFSNTSDYAHLLDERLDTFREYLNQELDGLTEDAVEIAFMRCVPEAIGKLQKRCENCGKAPCKCDGDEEEEHDFEELHHCEACSEHWWGTHNLTDCIAEGELSNCTKHEDHALSECMTDGDPCYAHDDHDIETCLEAGTITKCSTHEDHDADNCEWKCPSHLNHNPFDCDWECDSHVNHNLGECADGCNAFHKHEDWHLYIGEYPELKASHDSSWPECDKSLV